MAEWYEIAIPVASLITAIVALITIFYLRKQIKISETSYNDSRKAYESDVLMRLYEQFSLDKDTIQLREDIAFKRPIFKDDGGKYSEKDIFTYLNTLHIIPQFIRMGVLSEYNAVNFFGSAFLEAFQHKDIKNFVEQIQNEQSKGAWGDLLELSDKFEKLRELSKEQKPIKPES